MSPMAAARLIAAREIRERLQGRLLRVVTVLTALLVVAAVVVPSLIHHRPQPTRVGLVGPAAQALATPLTRTARASQTQIRFSDIADERTARAQLRAGKLDVALELSAAGALLEAKQALPGTARAVVGETLDEIHLRRVLAAAGVGASTVDAALTPVPVRTVTLKRPPTRQTARYIAAAAAALLMYMSLTIYGVAVAQGVAQEKTTRTAEVLLAAVRPGELLTGKVVGIGLCGLGQLAVAAAAGLIANALVRSAVIPSSVWVMMPAFLAYFLAGFALYAFALAAAGAMVARQEEVQFATAPFSMVLMIGYILVFVAAGTPDATWLRIVSFLPPLTASVMPARIALGHVAPWEIAVQAVLMAAAIYGTVRLAGRIYAGALTRGGARLTLRAALRLNPGPRRRALMRSGD